MEKNEYNPLEIKEGYIPRFITWCKKKIKAIVTIGSIGLVLAALQTYKAFFSPNVAHDISNTIISTIQEYDALRPIVIPDSIMGNQEIKLLKEYQDEFEIFKLYLSSLDYSKIEAKEDTTKISMYMGRYQNALAYGEESQKILEIIQKVADYEQNVMHSESFGKTVDLNTMYLITLSQSVSNAERNRILHDISFYYKKGFKRLTKREKKDFYRKLERGYASEESLATIKLQTKFYKNFYIATSIRLLELINEKK